MSFTFKSTQEVMAERAQEQNAYDALALTHGVSIERLTVVERLDDVCAIGTVDLSHPEYVVCVQDRAITVFPRTLFKDEHLSAMQHADGLVAIEPRGSAPVRPITSQYDIQDAIDDFMLDFQLRHDRDYDFGTYRDEFPLNPQVGGKRTGPGRDTEGLYVYGGKVSHEQQAKDRAANMVAGSEYTQRDLIEAHELRRTVIKQAEADLKRRGFEPKQVTSLAPGRGMVVGKYEDPEFRDIGLGSIAVARGDGAYCILKVFRNYEIGDILQLSREHGDRDLKIRYGGNTKTVQNFFEGHVLHEKNFEDVAAHEVRNASGETLGWSVRLHNCNDTTTLGLFQPDEKAYALDFVTEILEAGRERKSEAALTR